MDIPALKQQARTLEQAGSVEDAIEVYRQVLAELEAIGGIRQELPLLIKIGDLLAKSDDIDGAVQMYERAAGEYAQQGAAQPVISLCVKILRADPQETGAYLRLARRLLDAGHTDGAREVLIDYAQRGQLDRTRQGLEQLRGRPDEEIKRLLDKAIFTAEQRLARRTPRPPRAARPRRPPRAAAPAAPPEPVPEEEEPPEPDEEEEPESEPELPGPPKRRITVPVGAMDGEPTDVTPPSPPETKPEEAFPTAEELTGAPPPRQPRESRPQDAFPSPEDLQAPVLPTLDTTPTPPPPAEEMEPPVPPPLGIDHGVPGPLAIDASLAPAPRDSQPGLKRPELPPEDRGWSPEHAGAPREGPPPPPPRVPQPRPARPRRPRSSIATRAPRRTTRRRRGWLWFLLLVVVGGGGVLVWREIIPLDRLRQLFGKTEAAAPSRGPAGARTRPRGDSVMARDTAGFRRAPRPQPTPATPSVPTLVLPQMPVTLPAGVTLARSIYVVRGLQIESVTPDSSGAGLAYTIVQVLPPAKRIILHEQPTDTVAAGEIGVTSIDPDTAVGHTGIGGLVVTLKGVMSDDVVVQLLQQLIEIRP